jgi:molecular chaperone HtpG
MRRILEAAGQAMPETKPTLEMNAGHALLRHLDTLADDEAFDGLAACCCFEQAKLAESGSVANPGEFARRRLNRVLARLMP